MGARVVHRGGAGVGARASPWAGWSTIIWNVGILAVLVLTSRYGMYYPVVHFIAPLIIGIALLSRRRAPAGARRPRDRD
jgi:hypothetical protein